MARIVRFLASDAAGSHASYGRLEAGSVEVLGAAPWLGGLPTGERLPFDGLRLLAPCEPRKIVCVGRNYAEHAKELGNEVPAEPLIFLKPGSAVIGPGEAIVRPRASQEVHYEAELGVLIGRRCRKASPQNALSFVAGYTCVNDVTARDIQRAEKHFTRAKGFDSFCPVGPWIEEAPGHAGPRAIRCRVDGALRQDGNTRQFVFDVPAVIAFVSGVMTLEPGDLIATGTPAGVGPLLAGEVVEVEVEGVGILANPVQDEE